jgi:excisionase family DNA binding protein
MTENDSRLMDVRGAAKFLKLAPGTVYHLVSAGRLPVVRLSSRCLRFDRLALEKFVSAHSVPAK